MLPPTVVNTHSNRSAWQAPRVVFTTYRDLQSIEILLAPCLRFYGSSYEFHTLLLRFLYSTWRGAPLRHGQDGYCYRGSDKQTGEHIEGIMNAEVHAGEGDEDA
jgi:hypothetical protein